MIKFQITRPTATTAAQIHKACGRASREETEVTFDAKTNVISVFSIATSVSVQRDASRAALKRVMVELGATFNFSC